MSRNSFVVIGSTNDTFLLISRIVCTIFHTLPLVTMTASLTLAVHVGGRQMGSESVHTMRSAAKTLVGLCLGTAI